jgi:hypothetical protein
MSDFMSEGDADQVPTGILVPPLHLDDELMPPPEMLAAPAPPPDAPNLCIGDDAAAAACFDHYADDPTRDPGVPKAPTLGERAEDFVNGLGTRKGLQADKDGAGITLGDWRLRVKPDF